MKTQRDKLQNKRYTVTQTPPVKSAEPGSTVTLSCKTGTSVYLMWWYQVKPGEAPKITVWGGESFHTVVSEMFSGSVSGTDYTLQISDVQPDDAADYYCTYSTSQRFGHTKPPTKQSNMLPPSGQELSSKRTASLVCLANGGFPSSWALSWKVDGASRGSSVASSTGLLQSGGLYGWSSTLTLTEQEWSSAKEVTCEATEGGQSAIPKTLRKSDCLG
uniref:Immunoglobulin light iota constant 1, s1 n=1 Tax=Paramormyrops kingsleyae TaxID=1676925 RepID=A0A3B3Q9V3_9TELE